MASKIILFFSESFLCKSTSLWKRGLKIDILKNPGNKFSYNNILQIPQNKFLKKII